MNLPKVELLPNTCGNGHRVKRPARRKLFAAWKGRYLQLEIGWGTTWKPMFHSDRELPQTYYCGKCLGI